MKHQSKKVQVSKRFWNKPKPLFNTWRRSSDVIMGMKFEKVNHFGKFDDYAEENMYLDWDTTRAALDASPFVVALISYTGTQRLFICSGAIIYSHAATDGQFFATILTCATLVRCPTPQDTVPDHIKVDVYLFDRSMCEGEILGYDFHYNVAAIRIKSNVQLQTAIIGHLDDYMESHSRFGDRSFHLARHRDTPTSDGLIKLHPGMPVIALGRYYDDSYHIMAAPGKLITTDSDSELDCEELVMTCSEITKNGIGGPLITYSGCVIGLSFYTLDLTPFLPINIALKCLEHLLKFREVPRPWLGLELSDLDTIELDELERLIHSSPTLSGVLVRKVELRSPASDAGICSDDIIIQVDGKHVGSSLEFTTVLLDKAKEPMEVIVKRAGSIAPLTLTVLPQNAEKLNRWPLPEECWMDPR